MHGARRTGVFLSLMNAQAEEAYDSWGRGNECIETSSLYQRGMSHKRLWENQSGECCVELLSSIQSTSAYANCELSLLALFVFYYFCISIFGRSCERLSLRINILGII